MFWKPRGRSLFNRLFYYLPVWTVGTHSYSWPFLVHLIQVHLLHHLLKENLFSVWSSGCLSGKKKPGALTPLQTDFQLVLLRSSLWSPVLRDSRCLQFLKLWAFPPCLVQCFSDSTSRNITWKTRWITDMRTPPAETLRWWVCGGTKLFTFLTNFQMVLMAQASEAFCFYLQAVSFQFYLQTI